MADPDEVKKVVDALKMVEIAIQSLNPDPKQTIAEHRKSQRRREIRATYGAIVGTIALLVSVGQLLVGALASR